MPKPILQSLILADHVYEDKLTGKRIIAGVFNRIIRGVRVVREIPAPAPAPPPSQAQPQPPYQAPPQPNQPAAPIHVQPTAPVQPAEPIQVHHGQVIPNQPAEPSQPSPAPYTPSAPAAHTPASSQPAPTAAPHQAAPVQPPPTPAPAPHSPPPAPPIPPPPQQAQRVLEIPPTGLQSGSPFAYLSLTEVRGVTPLLLQLVNLQDDTQLFRSDLRVECHNPLYTVELTVPLPPIAPPQAGIYALELLYNNELLGALRIVVEDAAQQ